jgi:Cu-Zn family superoxide dismutase
MRILEMPAAAATTTTTDSILYRSGDLFLNDAAKKFLYSYIAGNDSSLVYINYWSVIHFLSGILVFMGLRLLGIDNYYLIGLVIHTLWEFWQLSIGMTKLNPRGLIDIGMDTGIFMGGMGLAAHFLASAAAASATSAVAVFQGPAVRGEVVVLPSADGGCDLQVKITDMPAGEHGFHIHTAGDLRGEGCKGACAHFHKGAPAKHGGAPGFLGERHTGDLGNIKLAAGGKPFRHTYHLPDVEPAELWGRSLIVHADPDDLGAGGHEDSAITGHSGGRIACAIFGRAKGCDAGAGAAAAAAAAQPPAKKRS